MDRRHVLRAAGASALCAGTSALWPATSTAQDARPIRLLVPTVPGAVPDIANRELGRRLQAELGQTVVVENKPGGTGTVMVSELRRAAADGHTLAAAFLSTLSVTPNLMKPQPYHPVQDFSHLGIWCHGYFALAVPAASPWRSVADVLAAARSGPAPVNFGTAGVATPGHLFVTQWAHAAGVQLNHIPFKGSADVVLSGVRADVPLITDGTQLVLPQVAAGKLRAIAVFAPRRLAALPDTPTLAELGFAGIDHPVWHGLFAPAGLPAAVSARLQTALAKVTQQSDFVRWNEEAGRFVEWRDGEQMRSQVSREFAFWAREIQRAGITTG
jgi:tripartite-type tricarboxylate transporter receptor subunit TctC